MNSGAGFKWYAKFKSDAEHDPRCCEVRQFINQNKHFLGGILLPGFAPRDRILDVWHEDRSHDGGRYGRRTGDYSDLYRRSDSYDWYAGDEYWGSDRPLVPDPPGLKLLFQLRVVDVCNGGRTIHTSKTLTMVRGASK